MGEVKQTLGNGGRTMTALNTALEQVPAVGMVPAPALMAYVKLLALPGAELEQTVADELAQNPALIQDETRTCGTCGIPAEPPCPHCGGQYGAPKTSAKLRSGWEPQGSGPAACTSWQETLLRDLRLMVARDDAGVAALVVASLDERGYLVDDLPELAQTAGVQVAAVERVVRVLRASGPPGIGARDLRHCLLLQLDRLAVTGSVHPVARAVVAGHLDALARGATASIARRLGVRADEVTNARAFIRRELLPRPAVPGEPHAGRPVVPVRPDVALSRSADRTGSCHVDVLEEHRLVLRVDPDFRRLARADAKLAYLVKRGDFFLARLRERWSTMRRITEYVAGQRPDLLTGEAASGGRLTRAEVAAGLGLNASTVSRATAGRYLLLPSRNVISYAAVFDVSGDVRSELRDIIAAENQPLSDAELCERLQRAGHQVARRTVAKYRNRLQLLPSTYR
jgi:RNA polymerase sigma-54 factor